MVCLPLGAGTGGQVSCHTLHALGPLPTASGHSLSSRGLHVAHPMRGGSEGYFDPPFSQVRKPGSMRLGNRGIILLTRACSFHGVSSFPPAARETY